MGTKVVTPRMYTYVRPMETTRHLDGWVFAAVIGQVSGLQCEWNHKAHMPTCERWLKSRRHQVLPIHDMSLPIVAQHATWTDGYLQQRLAKFQVYSVNGITRRTCPLVRGGSKAMGTKVVTPRMYTYVRPMETTRDLDGWGFAAVTG